jgi:hypothetical protein
MRTKTRRARAVDSSTDGGSTAATSADESSHGTYALSPLKIVIQLGVSGIFFIGASIFQTTGTEQSVLHNLLSTLQVTPMMIFQQTSNFLAGKLDFYQGIAFAIGFGVQFTLFMIAFPASSAYTILHRRYNPAPDGEMSEGATTIKKWQDIAMRVIIGGDLLTDVLYITNNENFLNHGHQVFSMVLWIIPWPNLDGANAGILVVGVLYAALLCFVNVVSVKMFVAYLEILLLRMRGLV